MKFDRNLHLIERGRTGANVGWGGEGSLHFMQPKIQQGQLQDHFVHDSKFIKVFLTPSSTQEISFKSDTLLVIF